MKYKGQCGSCKHFGGKDQHGGKCYRYPPVILMDLRQDFNGDYYTQVVQERTSVLKVELCGEHQERDND